MELIPIWRILRGTLPFRTVHLHDEKGNLEGAISEQTLEAQISNFTTCSGTQSAKQKIS